MLTKRLVRDEATASLGKIENSLMVDALGEVISSQKRIRQSITQEVKEYNSRELKLFRLLVRLVGV
jgi:hypothetical protein